MKRKLPQKNGLRSEYDFDYSTAVRGKYYKRLLKEGSNIVVLDPDVAKAYRTSAKVNKVLRSLLERGRASPPTGKQSTPTARKRAAA